MVCNVRVMMPSFQPADTRLSFVIRTPIQNLDFSLYYTFKLPRPKCWDFLCVYTKYLYFGYLHYFCTISAIFGCTDGTIFHWVFLSFELF